MGAPNKRPRVADKAEINDAAAAQERLDPDLRIEALLAEQERRVNAATPRRTRDLIALLSENDEDDRAPDIGFALIRRADVQPEEKPLLPAQQPAAMPNLAAFFRMARPLTAQGNIQPARVPLIERNEGAIGDPPNRGPASPFKRNPDR